MTKTEADLIGRAQRQKALGGTQEGWIALLGKREVSAGWSIAVIHKLAEWRGGNTSVLGNKYFPCIRWYTA